MRRGYRLRPSRNSNVHRLSLLSRSRITVRGRGRDVRGKSSRFSRAIASVDGGWRMVTTQSPPGFLAQSVTDATGAGHRSHTDLEALSSSFKLQVGHVLTSDGSSRTRRGVIEPVLVERWRCTAWLRPSLASPHTSNQAYQAFKRSNIQTFKRSDAHGSQPELAD